MGIDNERNDSAMPSHDPLIDDVLSIKSAGEATSILSPTQGEQQPGDPPIEHLAYWKQQLQGASTNLNLPTDRPYPAVHTFVGAWQEFELPQALTAHLTMLSQQEGVSFFLILLASFQVLLARYSGKDDFLVGTSIFTGSRAAPRDTLHTLTNLLVLRADTSGNPTFRDVVQRVRQAVTEAQAHQNLPFTQVMQDLLPEPEPSRHPLFQVMFVLGPPLVRAQEEGAFTPGLLEQTNERTRPDLTLWIQESEQEFRGWIEYNRALFDAQTIMRLEGHWQTLLEGSSTNPEQRIDDLPLLTGTELHQLLVAWNSAVSDYPHDQDIQHLFEAQVKATPDAVALVFEQHYLTYRELNRRANQLAHYLRRQGVGQETLVGICMERSPEMVVGLLGILKAGGAYVPLDPYYPGERLAFMLEDARPAALLTQQYLVERLPAHRQAICQDASWPVIAQESGENLAIGGGGDNLAYMLYTSGSTGTPKGVLGTHRASINRFQWMWNTYPFGPGEVCCQKTTLNFVDSVWEIFGPLLQGVRAIIIPDLVLKDSRQLLKTLAAHAVTRIVLVPSLLRVLLDTSTDLQNQLPKLKYWISSGETLPRDLALRFLESMPRCILLNLYGSSEVAADATCFDMRSYTPSLSSIPIGRPIANIQVYLLDTDMQLVPIGVPGELYVGGDGLARGYFNRPELTAERFVPNPFSSEPGARLYKTGDVCRYLPDGNIEYLGRLDYQVKIRGFRIELGEIEAILSQHLAIKEVVVVAREDTPADKRLVAYLVHNPALPKPSIEALHDFLKEKLPPYMLPATFVFLDALPLMPNGKINRKALLVPEHARPELQSAFQGARTPLEETIATFWSQVLAIEGVGIHDNFFALGGNSLHATQILSRLQVTFQVDVPLRSFFEAPTVAQLAELIQQLQATSLKPELPPIRRVPREAYRVPSGRESHSS